MDAPPGYYVKHGRHQHDLQHCMVTATVAPNAQQLQQLPPTQQPLASWGLQPLGVTFNRSTCELHNP